MWFARSLSSPPGRRARPPCFTFVEPAISRLEIYQLSPVAEKAAVRRCTGGRTVDGIQVEVAGVAAPAEQPAKADLPKAFLPGGPAKVRRGFLAWFSSSLGSARDDGQNRRENPG